MWTVEQNVKLNLFLMDFLKSDAVKSWTEVGEMTSKSHVAQEF